MLLAANVLFFGYLVLLEPEPNVVVTNAIPLSETASIVLLSEQGGLDERSVEVVEVLSNPVTADPEGTDTSECRGLGPFEDVLIAQNVTERLNATGIEVTLNAVDTPTGEYDFRVVLPPLASVQEAFRRLRELKSREIDSYVITQGEDAQGISLGVFSTQEAAESHQVFLGERGYQVEIKQIPRLSRGYWIQATGGILSIAAVDDLIGEFPEVSLTETACIN